jgi:hypothetical protein
MAKKNPPVLKSVAIHQLRALAVELKKTPTVRDIAAGARENKCPPMSIIRKLFGTSAKALKAANLPPQRNQEFTEEQLIEQLQDLSHSLGRHVNRRDIKKAGKKGTCARLVTFRRAFGNTETALRKARVGRVGRYTRDELIAQYRSLYKELGKLPTYYDIHRAAREGRCGGYKVFRRRCGTLEQLRENAGLVQGPRLRYSRQELLDQLNKLAMKLGRTPIVTDLIVTTRAGECADVATFRTYFGTYNKALAAAGLRPNRITYSRGQLILMLQALAKKLGHRPTVKEVNEARLRGECASAPTYDNWFGNLSAALRAAKLDALPPYIPARKPSKQPKKYTRRQLEEQLRRLGKRLGRTPAQRDAAAASRRRECAAVSTIRHEFGSFSGALRSIGFDVKERPREYSRNQLIQQLQQLTRDLSRLPMTKDIQSSHTCAAAETFIKRFGSLTEARKAAKLDDILRASELGVRYARKVVK